MGIEGRQNDTTSYISRSTCDDDNVPAAFQNQGTVTLLVTVGDVYVPTYLQISYNDETAPTHVTHMHDDALQEMCMGQVERYAQVQMEIIPGFHMHAMPENQRNKSVKYFGKPRPMEHNKCFVEIRFEVTCGVQIEDKKYFLFLFLPRKEKGHISFARTCYAWDFMCLMESGWGPPICKATRDR